MNPYVINNRGGCHWATSSSYRDETAEAGSTVSNQSSANQMKCSCDPVDTAEHEGSQSCSARLPLSPHISFEVFLHAGVG